MPPKMGWKLRPTPDVQRYVAWQAILRDYPGGLMLAAEAAKMLGVATQTVCQWSQQAEPCLLDRVTVRGDKPGRWYVPTDQVLALVEKSQIPELWR